MTYEHLFLGVVVAGAVYYLWRTLVKKGCSCGNCPSAQKQGCCLANPVQELDKTRDCSSGVAPPENDVSRKAL